jgi:hypothetical protein
VLNLTSPGPGNTITLTLGKAKVVSRRVAAKTVARAAALAVILAASGIAAGAASGAASASRPQATTLPQATTVRLVYACRFPSRTRQTSVQISAIFPAKAVAGGPIQPTGVTLAVKLPPAGVADLVKRHASAVRASAELTLGVAQAGKSATVAWPGLEVPETTVPSAGSMTLDASGAVPPIIVGGSGNVTVTAGSLLLALTVRTASDASTGPLRTAGGTSPSPSPSPGRTVASPDVRIACTPVAGQVATLATVPVARARGQVPASAPQAAVHPPLCPKLPRDGYKQNKRFPLPKPPAGAIISSPAPAPGCAYTGGYADVLKLNGAGLITPGEVNLDTEARLAYCFPPDHVGHCRKGTNYFQEDNYGQLNYNGLPEFPPSTTTFLAFGFEPVSATLHLIEIGTLNAVAIGPYSATDPPCSTAHPCQTITTVSSYLYIRVTNVAINGVPLNVGADCGTAPFDAIVTGTTPFYVVTTGGPVTGTIDIPPFTNCGVGEDLNPLFTASISGPDNVSLLTQGPACLILGGGTCNPHTGKPEPPKKLLHSFVG